MGDYTLHSLYTTYSHMIRRCYNPSNEAYKDYGGRGISICKRWYNGKRSREGFLNFVEDMGPKPTGYSVDRIDNDGDYSPDNCHWATAKTQARNRSTTKLTDSDIPEIFDLASQGFSQRAIAREFNVAQPTIGRILRGKSWQSETIKELV